MHSKNSEILPNYMFAEWVCELIGRSRWRVSSNSKDGKVSQILAQTKSAFLSNISSSTIVAQPPVVHEVQRDKASLGCPSEIAESHALDNFKFSSQQ